MIVAVILAAGESNRMGGEPKANLLYRGRTFLNVCVSVFIEAGIDHVRCVVGSRAEEVRRKNADVDAEFIANPDFALGRMSSIRTGLSGLPERCGAVIMHNVDQPLIRTDTVKSIACAFERHTSPVVLPVFGNKRGHPVLFARGVFDDLRNAPEETGARSVVWDNEDALIEVPVDDHGIIININTPLDYNKWCLRCSCDD